MPDQKSDATRNKQRLFWFGAKRRRGIHINWLRQVWQDFRHGENIDLYVTVAVSIILVVLGIFTIVPESWIVPLNLAVLALLSIAILGNRYRTESILDRMTSTEGDTKLQRTVARIEDRLHNLFPANPPLRFRSDLPSLRDATKNAKDIFVIARTAINLLRQADVLEDRLKEGATIRIAIMDPECIAAIDFIPPLQETTKNGAIADRLSAQGLIGRIRERAAFPERFQVRVFDHIPTISFCVLDGSLPNGRIVAEMVPYQVGSSRRPHLHITAIDAPEWYSYFYEVCESVWRDARPLRLNGADETGATT